MQYVYILLCNNGHTYVGCTKDLRARINQHNEGSVTSTKSYLPVKLLFYCAFPDKIKAFNFEKYLKSGSGRAFMNKRLY
ncbi:MAG: GIY-YIG nuclease family protein [Sediminibacterium sp.]